MKENWGTYEKSCQAAERLRFADREQRIDRTQAQRFAFAGLRRQSRQWPSGTYHGERQLRREQGENALTRTRSVIVQLP